MGGWDAVVSVDMVVASHLPFNVWNFDPADASVPCS